MFARIITSPNDEKNNFHGDCRIVCDRCISSGQKINKIYQDMHNPTHINECRIRLFFVKLPHGRSIVLHKGKMGPHCEGAFRCRYNPKTKTCTNRKIIALERTKNYMCNSYGLGAQCCTKIMKIREKKVQRHCYICIVAGQAGRAISRKKNRRRDGEKSQ